jgi:N-acetylglucosaminyldiphosphoundecaprenol N-acetyl-beta-D-mannosaminyltransferase
MKVRTLDFFKIKFINDDYRFIIKYLLKKKGYLVAPAASSLVNIAKDHHYLKALQKSSVAILDSGFFCLLILFLKLKKVKKFSGYKFIKSFINDENLKNFKILSLESTIKNLNKNKYLLKSKKFKFTRHYLCPIYKQDLLYDKKLITLIIKYKPKIIIINIGGGVQEKLALYIKNSISWKISILCTGAALSFISDTSTFFKINNFIDKYYLGWFSRSLNNPTFFYERVLKSFKLFFLVFKSKIKFNY